MCTTLKISTLLLCFLYLFVKLMITVFGTDFVLNHSTCAKRWDLHQRVCDDEHGDLFYSAGRQENCASLKRAERVFGKMKMNALGIGQQ